MPLNREPFFTSVRLSLFGGSLSQSQVDGLNRILDEWERRTLSDIRQLAYMLATVYHETATTMQPIKEGGGEAYLKSKPYYPAYGRGLVQCTWDVNYKKFGCTSYDDMLTWPFALRALFDGMRDGVFTGRKLSTYFSDKIDDPVGARHIINGTDKAALIATYHNAFLAALKLARFVPSVAAPKPPIVTATVTYQQPVAPNPREPAVAPPRETWGQMLARMFFKRSA